MAVDILTMWLIGCVIGFVPTVMEVRWFLSRKEVVHGLEMPKRSDPSDWILFTIFSTIVVFLVWPYALVMAGYRPLTTRRERREYKRRLYIQKQDEAFKKLKEAQKCLMQQKRQAYRDLVTEWDAEFAAADTYMIAAVKRSRELHEQRQAEREAERRIERERIYSDAKGYFGRVCRHGNSLDFPCSLCF